MSEEKVGMTEFLELLHKKAVKANAEMIKIVGHKCKNLDGYCYEIIVRKHNLCEDEE